MAYYWNMIELNIFFTILFHKNLSHLLYKWTRERAVGNPSMIEGQTAIMLNFANGTLSAMLNEFKFRKVSEESLSRDGTPRQTCHELFFHKNLSHFLYFINALLK